MWYAEYCCSCKDVNHRPRSSRGPRHLSVPKILAKSMYTPDRIKLTYSAVVSLVAHFAYAEGIVTRTSADAALAAPVRTLCKNGLRRSQERQSAKKDQTKDIAILPSSRGHGRTVTNHFSSRLMGAKNSGSVVLTATSIAYLRRIREEDALRSL